MAITAKTAANSVGISPRKNPYDLAASLVGKGEVPDRSTIQEYLKNGGVNLDPATTAWCAAYVNSSLTQAGLPGTGSNAARSFLDYGEKVDKPQKGDIAVFSRGDPNGWQGHVGFFDSYNPDGTIKLLAGNQGNAVSYANYGSDKLLGFRRPPGEGVSPETTASVPGRAASPSVFGSMAPRAPADSSIDPNVAQYAFAEEPKPLGSRLQAAGKAFDDAVMPAARPLSSFPGGPSGDQANGLLKLLQNPQALAQMYMKQRMG